MRLASLRLSLLKISAEMNSEEQQGATRPLLKVNRRQCPHCGIFLSLKTYKAHKRRYYDSEVSIPLIAQLQCSIS